MTCWAGGTRISSRRKRSRHIDPTSAEARQGQRHRLPALQNLRHTPRLLGFSPDADEEGQMIAGRAIALVGPLCWYRRCWEPVTEHRPLRAGTEHHLCLYRQLRELKRNVPSEVHVYAKAKRPIPVATAPCSCCWHADYMRQFWDCCKCGRRLSRAEVEAGAR